MLLVVRPGAPSSFLLLVERPGAPSSFLLLVVRPGTPSSFLLLLSLFSFVNVFLGGLVCSFTLAIFAATGSVLSTVALSGLPQPMARCPELSCQKGAELDPYFELVFAVLHGMYVCLHTANGGTGRQHAGIPFLGGGFKSHVFNTYSIVDN